MNVLFNQDVNVSTLEEFDPSGQALEDCVSRELCRMEKRSQILRVALLFHSALILVDDRNISFGLIRESLKVSNFVICGSIWSASNGAFTDLSRRMQIYDDSRTNERC